MSGQLTLDLAIDPIEYPDPDTCGYAEPVQGVPHVVLCGHPDGGWYTTCKRGMCGEPPVCTLKPLDNTPTTIARRLKWIKRRDGDQPSST